MMDRTISVARCSEVKERGIIEYLYQATSKKKRVGDATNWTCVHTTVNLILPEKKKYEKPISLSSPSLNSLFLGASFTYFVLISWEMLLRSGNSCIGSDWEIPRIYIK